MMETLFNARQSQQRQQKKHILLVGNMNQQQVEKGL